MFCVIQEVKLKKPNKGGDYKEYEVTSSTFTNGDGTQTTSYSYYPNYDSGKFERPHREAYKISLHQNYRENGKVKTKQCVLGTIDYYVIAGGWGLYDYAESGLKRASKMFGKTEDELYALAEAKFEPLCKKIQREYQQSEEYKTVRERERIQKAYQKAKAAFAKQYSVDESEYDYCFDVFGHVMNQTYLDEIKQRSSAYSSYHGSSYDNYTGSNTQGNCSGYSTFGSGNYTDGEKQSLKKFYRVLATKFHPDMNPGQDTTAQMQLLNKLKESWGI